MRKRTRITVDDQCSLDELVSARLLLNEMIAAKREPLKPISRKPTTLDELGITVRLVNALRNGGVSTVAQLTSETPLSLLHLRGVAPRSVRDLQSALARFGLTLAEPSFEVLP
nr:DNA-directed RNA polymerase subunit alpha C-terminal domain-containing protein [Paraburkholderia sp. BL8N3]